MNVYNVLHTVPGTASNLCKKAIYNVVLMKQNKISGIKPAHFLIDWIYGCRQNEQSVVAWGRAD
jgi:hypothetical protein